MRVLYALMAFVMGSNIWRMVLSHPHWDRWHGVGVSLLAALAVMAAVGIRYPLQMLPVLLFEFTWKLVFVLAFALPLYSAGQLDAANRETMVECLMGIVLCPIAIPWGYVWRNYVRKPGDRWKPAPSRAQAGQLGQA
jgi:hypothetical protein